MDHGPRVWTTDHSGACLSHLLGYCFPSLIASITYPLGGYLKCEEILGMKPINSCNLPWLTVILKDQLRFVLRVSAI